MNRAKIHAVTIGATTHLVWALTRAGAVRDVAEHLAGGAHVDVASGEQMYAAGVAGQTILGVDKYKNAVDPNQQDLPLNGADHD